MHAALVAASACRDTAEREHFYASCSWGQRVLKPLPTCSRMLCRYQDGLAKKELDDAADRFERWSGGNSSQPVQMCLPPGWRASFLRTLLCLAKAVICQAKCFDDPVSAAKCGGQVWTTSSVSLLDGRHGLTRLSPGPGNSGTSALTKGERTRAHLL